MPCFSKHFEPEEDPKGSNDGDIHNPEPFLELE
jgi:hypothetical protein